MAALDLFLVATAGVDVAALQTTLNSRLPLLPSPSPRLLLWGDFGGARIDFWSEHEPTQLLARCRWMRTRNRFSNCSWIWPAISR